MGTKQNLSLVCSLSNVLKNCPNLTTLGLGLACESEGTWQPVTLIEDQGEFLEKLCLRYEKEANTNPLPLSTLRLGHGLCLYKSNSTMTDSYLSKLIDLPRLRRLDLFNDLVTQDFNEDQDGSHLQIHWPLLGDCNSLHQMSVSRLTKNVLQWLNSGAVAITELIVTHHYGMVSPPFSTILLEISNVPKTQYPES